MASISKSSISDHTMQKFSLSRQDADAISGIFFSTIRSGIQNTGHVVLKNFGKFEKKIINRKRFLMDFKTGKSQTIDVSENSIRFAVSHNFKQELKK